MTGVIIMGLFGKKYKGASFTTETGTITNFSESKLAKAYEALSAEKISYIHFRFGISGGGTDTLKISRDKKFFGILKNNVKKIKEIILLKFTINDVIVSRQVKYLIQIFKRGGFSVECEPGS